MNVERFELDLRSHAIAELFAADLDRVRAAAPEQHDGRGRVPFPSFELRGEDGRVHGLYGEHRPAPLREAAAGGRGIATPAPGGRGRARAVRADGHAGGGGGVRPAGPAGLGGALAPGGGVEGPGRAGRCRRALVAGLTWRRARQGDVGRPARARPPSAS